MHNKKKSTNPNEFPVYGKMTQAEMNIALDDLFAPIKMYAKELNYNWEDIQINYGLIADIIDLIQRRRVYFHVFHEIEMGELNQSCLLCFWILKFCPFHYTKNPDNNINFSFALSTFTRAVNYTAEKRKMKANFSKEIFLNLKHAFKYRDLSKEAIMAIAESLIC
ncbi:MAG: hypothetical protein FWG98_06435 [Candidatus Cloacimonetes bacterium]|nr:hypothetical protein [Candidatus Cloacimonadota bacterium]